MVPGRKTVVSVGFDAPIKQTVSFLTHHEWAVTHIDVEQSLSAELSLDDQAIVLIDLRHCAASTETCNKIRDVVRHLSVKKMVALVPPELLELQDVKNFLQQNCDDYIQYPLDNDKLLAELEKVSETSTFTAEPEPDALATTLLGQCAAVKQLRKSIGKIAQVNTPVLITGETGTGKELVARALHDQSDRQQKPFIAMNCGSIASSLIQSELFGHEKGAFTGATQRKKGYLESAQGGTLFLDEIAELPREEQANLLRFLQDGIIQRVGSTDTIQLDVRVIAATNVDIEKAILGGEFREDLYYRLNTLELTIPPLRERVDDIVLLAIAFLDKYSHEYGKKVRGFNRECLQLMKTHPWKGNIRELINRVKRAVVMCDTPLVSAKDMGIEQQASEINTVTSIRQAREVAERKAILAALEHARHNVTDAAVLLGISRAMLYRLLSKYHLQQ